MSGKESRVSAARVDGIETVGIGREKTVFLPADKDGRPDLRAWASNSPSGLGAVIAAAETAELAKRNEIFHAPARLGIEPKASTGESGIAVQASAAAKELVYVPPKTKLTHRFHFKAILEKLLPALRARHEWEMQKLQQFEPWQRDLVLRHIKGNRRLRLQHRKHYYALEITRSDQERFLRRFKSKLEKIYGKDAVYDDQQLLRDHYVQSFPARVKIIFGAHRILRQIANLESRRMIDDWGTLVKNPDLRTGAIVDTIMFGCSDPREDVKTAGHIPIIAGAYLVRTPGPSLEAADLDLDAKIGGFINHIVNGHVRNLVFMGHSGCAKISAAGGPCSCCDDLNDGNRVKRHRAAFRSSKTHIQDMVRRDGVEYYLKMIDSPPLPAEEAWLRAMEVANVMFHKALLDGYAEDIVNLYAEENNGSKIPLPKVLLGFHDMNTESILIYNEKKRKFISVAEPLKPGEKIHPASEERLQSKREAPRRFIRTVVQVAAMVGITLTL